MTFLPSGLYSPTALAATFTAKQERQSADSQIQLTAGKSTAPMAFAPAEQKIQLYSGVRADSRLTYSVSLHS
jgi:hypothetical protein